MVPSRFVFRRWDNNAATVWPLTGLQRVHGSVVLDAACFGHTAGRIVDEVIAHLAGLVGTQVKVTLEIEAEIPTGGRRMSRVSTPKTTGL